MQREFKSACGEMFASVVEHEYYCGAYASKEQPRLKALMQSMSMSLKNVEDRIGAARREGVSFSNVGIAAKILHNLVGAVNRCSHKGYPEIVSYLTKQLSFYCSHAFTNLYMYNQQNEAEAVITAWMAKAEGKPVPQSSRHALHSTMLSKQKQPDDVDFQWRPAVLEHVPWYFFAAMTQAVSSNMASLPWFSRLKAGSTWITHPRGRVLHSRHFPEEVLLSGPSTDVPVAAPY